MVKNFQTMGTHGCPVERHLYPTNEHFRACLTSPVRWKSLDYRKFPLKGNGNQIAPFSRYYSVSFSWETVRRQE